MYSATYSNFYNYYPDSLFPDTNLYPEASILQYPDPAYTSYPAYYETLYPTPYNSSPDLSPYNSPTYYPTSSSDNSPQYNSPNLSTYPSPNLSTYPSPDLSTYPSPDLSTFKAEQMSPIELTPSANINHLPTNNTYPLSHLVLNPEPTNVSPLPTKTLQFSYTSPQTSNTFSVPTSSPTNLTMSTSSSPHSYISPTSPSDPLYTAQSLYSSQQYDQALLYISSAPFTDLPAARDLFYNIIYSRYSTQHPKNKMNACTRYRLRKKYPLPPTIAPSETTLYAMPLSTRSLLLQCFAADPYPCAEKKKYLSQVTNLDYTKINYWFKNMRANRSRKIKAAC